MGGALEAKPQIDLSGGENTVASPYLLGPKQSQQVQNFLLDEHGSLRVRDGTSVEQTASSNSTEPIVKVYDFVRSDGTIKQLAILYGASSANTVYDRSTNPWTPIANTTTGNSIPDIVVLNNLAIFCNGYETPKMYDTVSFNALVAAGNPPGGAKHLAVHLGYLWAWNTAAASTSANGPSALQSSDVNNPNSWPSAFVTQVTKDDGQSGQGLGLYTIAETGISPTATLIAFKDFSAYEVSGVFGSSNFSIQKIKSDMGCVAPRTIQFVSGFGIIRLTHKGFALFDGVNDVLISEEERPRLFGRDNYTGIDWTNVGRSMASQVQNPPLYICACPVSGPSLTRVFCYDLVRKSWTVLTFANAIASLQLLLDPNTLPQVHGGDYSAGFVRHYFAGDTTDDGTAISWTLVTKPTFAKSPMDRALFRRLIVKMFNMSTPSSVSAIFSIGPTAVTNTKTVQLASTLQAFNGFGIDQWGSSPWGAAPGSQNATDFDVNFDIGLKGNTCYATISGTGSGGTGRIRALEWHLRSMPLTRSTIGA